MKPNPKRRIFVIDAADPLEERAEEPWDDVARYMDKRRSYLESRSDVTIIRNEELGLERVVKSRFSPETADQLRQITAVKDTMASCGFGMWM